MTDPNPQPDPPSEPEATPEPEVIDETEQLRHDKAELESRILRLMADYQNIARRSRQEVGDARQQQLMDLARALVPVLDHFDLALSADPAKVTAESLGQGVKMVYDELLKTLAKFDIQRIDAIPGEEFDPRRHEAMMHQSVEGMAPGHVAQPLQAGYILGDKTIRPAKVSVTQ